MTISDAAHRWVSEMSRFPNGMLEKLWRSEPESWLEITPPALYDSVYLFNLHGDSSSHSGEIVDRDGDDFVIKTDDGFSVTVSQNDFELQDYGWLPMWGWLWQFDDICDSEWAESEAGLQALADCGFRVYKSDEFGIFFGIDGAGYDFYERHWIPLYKARGLRWHDAE